MPQFERRLYEPPDDIRVYDGGEDDYVDEGSRLPLLIVIALVVLASFAGVVWLAYTQGVQRGREDTPRIAAAAPAQNPGEQKNPYAGLQIYQPAKPNNESETATPPPAPAVVPKKPAAVPANKMTARTPPVVHPAIAAPKPAVATPRTITDLIASQQKNAQAAPAKKPVMAPVKAAPSPAQTASSQSAPAPQGGGGFVLQIGSYPSEAAATASWQTYKSAHAAVAGYAPDVQKADLGSKGTWYRLRVGPFASLSEASAACAKLKAQGGSCFPAKR
jgi:cell division protein FtsN